MTVTQALILGVLQGLTEFLPISSSGHLVLAETFLDLRMSNRDLQGFDVLLHAGTALALLLMYWQTWYRLSICFCYKTRRYRRLFWQLVVATIPGALAGLLLSDVIASQFRSTVSVSIALFVTGLFLIVTHMLRRSAPVEKVSFRHALIMGLVQALALIPGLSRSGVTISAGTLSGLEQKKALDFSFQMALPIILGALILTVKDVYAGAVSLPEPTVALLGFFTSFFVSVLAMSFLRQFVVKHSLAWFAAYLLPVSIILLVLTQVS